MDTERSIREVQGKIDRLLADDVDWRALVSHDRSSCA